MSDAQRKELSAFFSFFATFDLSRPVTTVADLCDGAALFEVLSVMYVIPSSISTRGSSVTNWVTHVVMQTTSARQHARPRNPQRIGSCGSVPSNDCIVS